MSDEQNTKTKDDVGTGTEDNLTIGQELGEFVRSGVGKALEAAEDLGGGIKDFMSNEEGTGMLDSLFDNEQMMPVTINWLEMLIVTLTILIILLKLCVIRKNYLVKANQTQ